MSFSPETIPLRAPGTQWSRLGEELVVLDGQGRMLRGFNPTGARVWELADGERSAAAIAAQLSREVGAADGRVLADVLEFLATLEQRSLVQAKAGGGA